MNVRTVAGRGMQARRHATGLLAIGLGIATATLASLALGSRAEASTINTYAFTQDGYVFTNGAAGSATVQGTFTGQVEPDGLMNLAGLTAFQLGITIDYGPGLIVTFPSLGMPSLFSFDTLSSPNASGGNSTLAIVQTVISVGLTDLCIGSPTAFACSTSAANGALPTYFLATSAFPHVTLTSSTAVTPIPAPILLFGTALASLALLRSQRRRRTQAA